MPLHMKYVLTVQWLYLSINQSMALSASCAGHTRTQSHATLSQLISEMVESEINRCGSEVSVR